MKVLTSGPSPYGRKVKMTAMMKGLYDRITFEEVDVRPVENEELRPQNPLAKIPVLITDDGTAIYDSHVICEFLDAQVASPALFPGDGAERWQTLTRGALGDGILDAALLMVYEKRFRPEDKWHADWLARQQAKVDGALDFLEANIPAIAREPDYGHMSIAVALGYHDLRLGEAWRESRPKLTAWHDDFIARVPAYNATRPE